MYFGIWSALKQSGRVSKFVLETLTARSAAENGCEESSRKSFHERVLHFFVPVSVCRRRSSGHTEGSRGDLRRIHPSEVASLAGWSSSGALVTTTADRVTLGGRYPARAVGSS